MDRSNWNLDTNLVSFVPVTPEFTRLICVLKWQLSVVVVCILTLSQDDSDWPRLRLATTQTGQDWVDSDEALLAARVFCGVLPVRVSMHRHTFAVQKHTHGIRCLNVRQN